ncbi:hypothetical protein [Streptomyces sp. TLI_146]|uniref:hypothetical protein n=1 Tax=Streptomyces sp. TLI_146 TaxID=1938858 RepID=UPI000C70592A|nr:hypothetical protein [Streptomyces sp. TLI_146]PKV87398.1 hypothetical protein BX283_4997 [Streptomyces sp. TLI_146]
MSFGDPNNPYGQAPPPPQAPPGYGYPAAPQGVPPQQAYGYPQQQPGYPAYPGGMMMAPQMPGLMQTARVLLFIVGAVQVLIGIVFLFIGAAANDVSNKSDDTFGDTPFGDIGHAAAGIMVVVALLFLGLSALSITLGVRLSRGRQGVRITTMVYGILGAVVGVLALVGSANNDSSGGLIWALLWISFGGIMAAAMMTRDGSAWFNRPRY